MNAFFGFLAGIAVSMILISLVLLPVSNKWTEEEPVMVETNNSGITCKLNKNYPKMNFVLIKEAIGPKLNTLKVEGK